MLMHVSGRVLHLAVVARYTRALPMMKAAIANAPTSKRGSVSRILSMWSWGWPGQSRGIHGWPALCPSDTRFRQLAGDAQHCFVTYHRSTFGGAPPSRLLRA